MLVISPEPTTERCDLPRLCDTIPFPPCLNDGVCNDFVVSGSYNCSCPSQFFGAGCQFFDTCSNSPCENNGNCFVDLSNINQFTCNCQAGYTGELCDAQISPCTNDPCLNGATCMDVLSNQLECQCIPGFTGQLCESNIDNCLNNPCQNGATCTDLVNGFSCECPPEFSGPVCSISVINCSPDSCQNGGTCIERANRFDCICPSGFTGPTCEENIDECQDNPCASGSTCFDGIGTFTCVCPSGITGDLCDTVIDFCTNSSCASTGSCVSLTNGFECDCNPGYTGSRCDIDIDHCDPNPCEMGGTCVDGINMFVCMCSSGVTGERCTVDLNECESNPCQNGATCLDEVNGFMCDCLPGFSGPTCEVEDVCFNQPCYNNGNCTITQSRFTCDCPPGWTGDRCQFAINVAYKLISCGVRVAYDVFSELGFVDGNQPIALSSGLPNTTELSLPEAAGFYWSAWVWQENDTQSFLFSFTDTLESTSVAVVSDLLNQQIEFHYTSPIDTLVLNFENTIKANEWHHVTIVALNNGTVYLSVDGTVKQNQFSRGNQNGPENVDSNNVPVFTTPSTVILTVGQGGSSFSSTAQPFSGIMRGIGVAGITASDFDINALDSCTLNCISGLDFCSNGGQCLDLFGPDRRCNCEFGYTGLQCQYLNSRFELDGTGHIETTNVPVELSTFKFSFKTEEDFAQLVSHSGQRVITSLELQNQSIVSISHDYCDSTMDAYDLAPSPSPLSDLQWHRISINEAVIQLNENQPEGFPLQNPSCNNSGVQLLTLGEQNNFMGCLRDVVHNGDQLDATSLQFKGGAQAGCTRDTAQFYGVSYIEFPRPDFVSREFQLISFDFSTLSSNGVIYFGNRVPTQATGPNPNDFIAIHLNSGQVTVSLNLGEVGQTVVIRNSPTVNDGFWHHVEAMQNGTMATLSVDGVQDEAVSMGPFTLLDTTGNVFLGGVPLRGRVPTFDDYGYFEGCIRDLEHNSVASDLQSSVAAQNVRYGTCN